MKKLLLVCLIMLLTSPALAYRHTSHRDAEHWDFNNEHGDGCVHSSGDSINYGC